MNCYSDIFAVLRPFVILYMVSMEIVSFCRIILLCNFSIEIMYNFDSVPVNFAKIGINIKHDRRTCRD